MGGNYTNLDVYKLLKNLRLPNIDVKRDFVDQVAQIDALLANDKTGLVSTIIDYKINASTVDIKIETENETLNDALQKWQKSVLNRNVSIGIPGGLRALSVENFRERWRSSLLALKVQWGEQKFENQGTLIVPKKMWFLDGASISSESGALNNKKYFITINKNKTELVNTKNQSIFIRRPYTAWHKNNVVPILVQRGTMFNSLIKQAIVQKQSDVIESVIPILLKLQAGNDQLALEGLGVSKEAFKELKDQLVEAKERFDQNHNFGDLIASLRHDVKLEYLIPEIGKVFDEKIVRSTDKNLLSSLGMIELQGFSSTRQEAILNPKVLVEEVVDAVNDWANLLQDVMVEMMERNRVKHPNLANNEIQVIPGIIKSFLTEDMKSMLRSLYDRGILSKQNISEDVANLNFEVQVNRRVREDERDLQTIMKPPVTINVEKDIDPELDNDNLEDQDKLPGTPEADNFNNAILKQYFAKEHLKRKKKKKKKKTTDYSEYIIQTPEDLPEEIKQLSYPAQLTYFMTYNTELDINGKTPEESHRLANEAIQMFLTSDKEKQVSEIKEDKKVVDKSSEDILEKEISTIERIIAPFKNIDELPESVKNVLPITAQILWMRVFNSIFDETGNEERAIRGAWSAVSEKYEKVDDKVKWVKKISIEDYKSEMSPYIYNLFIGMYQTAIDHSSSHSNAIKTALIIVEKVSKRNDAGTLVKDKSLTRDKLDQIDGADFVSKLLDLELREKKLKLIDRLLKEDNEN